MICHSALSSARNLVRQIRSDPLQVYVQGSIRGRSLSLTLEGMLEFDPELVVLGPDGSWRVHVRRELGKLVAIEIRVRNRRSKMNKVSRASISTR